MADRKRKLTPEDAEARERLQREREDQLYLHRARALLQNEDRAAPEDAQDERIRAVREAKFWGDMLIGAQDRQVNAELNYRLAKRLLNKGTQDNAESAMRDALRDQDIADPELRAVLPKCDVRMIAMYPAWQNLLLLPKEYRVLLGSAMPQEADDPEEQQEHKPPIGNLNGAHMEEVRP